MTPQQQRRQRLVADYEEMRSIRGAMIHWEAAGGAKPHFDRYLLTIRVRTIVGPGPNYAAETRINLELPNDYPFRAAPIVTIAAPPLPFHPNWWVNGQWCFGKWAPGVSLGEHVIRMVRTLQFDPVFTDPGSAANVEAAHWWISVQHRGWFPCDRQVLPDPTVKRGIKITKINR